MVLSQHFLLYLDNNVWQNRVVSIVIKDKKYAYLAYRSGKKVIHKYLGPIFEPRVAAKIKYLESEKNVPEKYHYLFWDTDPAMVDVKRHSRYIIERVLELGGLDALKWIQMVYPTRRILETLEISRKISLRSKNFWRIWFNGSHAS